MKIAIIDDELDARIILRSYIDRFMNLSYTLIEANSLKSGIQLIEEEKPDVIFLDIQLNDGTGFDLLNHFEERQFQIIFTTGHDKHAIKAFKYSAVDYLLKPIDPDEFKEAIQKILQKTNYKELDQRLQHLEELANKNSFDKIAFPTRDGTLYVQLQDIIHLNSDGSYTTIAVRDKKDILITRLLKDFEEMLPDTSFYRTHKSHIVNINYIEKYQRDDEVLLMIDGSSVPLARRRKEGLMALLG